MALKIKIFRDDNIPPDPNNSANTGLQKKVDDWLAANAVASSKVISVTTSSDQYGTNVTLAYDDGTS